MKYSSNLEVLLNQPVNNLTTQYKPDENLNKIEPPRYRNKPGFPNDPYYRVYTDTNIPGKGKIEQILSIKLYTREMKTALIKRRMETYNKELPEYNKHRDNDIRFNHLQYITEPEYYSIMFHLIELGDIIPSNYGYININDEIKKNKELMEWLPDIFKNSTKREERRRMLSFKYLVDKLERKFDEPISQVLKEELLSKARKTINYEKKRKLVLNNLYDFRKFTKDPNHFNVVKDLDYFFLVFESFFGEAKPEPKTPLVTNLPEPETPPAKPPPAKLPPANPAKPATNPAPTPAKPGTNPEPSITREEQEAKKLQFYYNIAIEYALNKDKIVRERQKDKDKALLNTYYLAYLSDSFEPDELLKYLNGEESIKNKGTEKEQKITKTQTELSTEREKIKKDFETKKNDVKIQYIYGFEIAIIESGKIIYGDDIVERFKKSDFMPNDWLLFNGVYRNYSKLMREVQQIIGEEKLAESIIAAKNIKGDKRTINPLYYNGELQDPPYQSFDGVFIVDKQVRARCGLHAINNLLQLKNPDCFASVVSCNLGNVLLGDSASDGDYLQSQQIVALINGDYIGQQGTREQKQFEPFLNNNYNATFLLPDYDYDRLRKTEDDKSFKGIIERNPEYRGHFVAWLLKKHGDQEYWYNIDSFGSITKYSYDEGLIVLKSRLKVNTESLAAANLAYEHIAVYGGEDLGRFDCFDLTLPEGVKVNDLGLGVATGGSKNKKNKNKSKKLYNSNKRLVKKSKKVRYN